MPPDVRFHGKGPYGVAVVHGGPGAPGSVAAIARELARDGTGVLEPLQTRTSLDGQVQELRDVLGTHATPPAVLIGHSWGAWLALIFASRHPEAVSRLVLVSSGPFEERYVPDLERRRLERLDPAERAEFLDLLRTAGAEDSLFARLGQLASKADSYDEVKVETDPADAIAVDGRMFQSVWTEAASMRRTGALLEHAGRLACPVLAIHGDHDPHPEAGVDEPLKAVVGDFRFVLLERCGHYPWRERHARDRFYQVLREFAARGAV